MTYRFTASLVEALGGQLQEIRITRLEADTYYATALLTGPAGIQHVDARPSDALNLALAAGAPIRVAEAVLVEWTTKVEEQLANQPGAADWQSQLSENAGVIVAELTERQSRLPRIESTDVDGAT